MCLYCLKSQYQINCILFTLYVNDVPIAYCKVVQPKHLYLDSSLAILSITNAFVSLTQFYFVTLENSMFFSIVRMSVTENLSVILNKVSGAYGSADPSLRAIKHPRLVAVSKTKPVEMIVEAYEAELLMGSVLVLTVSIFFNYRKGKRKIMDMVVRLFQWF